MIVYRLSKEQYASDLSGKGAELYGGRWNSKGIAMVYTSASRALCVAEIAVHTPLGILPKHYFMTAIEIPQSIKIKRVEEKDLPEHWKDVPHSSHSQQYGDAFVKLNKFAVLMVPSVVVPGDWNYLLNPAHSEMKSIRIREVKPFHFDFRLFK